MNIIGSIEKDSSKYLNYLSFSNKQFFFIRRKNGLKYFISPLVHRYVYKTKFQHIGL